MARARTRTAAAPVRGRNKYSAVRCPCDQGGTAHTHDSLAERRRCFVLHTRQTLGEIAQLHIHPKLELAIGAEVVCIYVADFAYFADGALIVEDVKGGQATRTPVYRLKKKLVHAIHGITIREVEA